MIPLLFQSSFISRKMNTNLEVFNISSFQNAPYITKHLCTTLPNTPPSNETHTFINSGYQGGKMHNTHECTLQADQIQTCAYLCQKDFEMPTEVRILYKLTCVHIFP